MAVTNPFRRDKEPTPPEPEPKSPTNTGEFRDAIAAVPPKRHRALSGGQIGQPAIFPDKTPEAPPSLPAVKKPTADEMFRVENQGTYDEVIHFWGDKDREVGYEFKTKFGDEPGEHNYAITSKEPVEGHPDLWAYTSMRKDMHTPYDPAVDEDEDFDIEEDKYRFINTVIGVLTEGGTGDLGGYARSLPKFFPKMSGRPERQMAIYNGIYMVNQNLKKFLGMLNKYHPDAVEGLNEAMNNTWMENRGQQGTLFPMAAIVLAVDDIVNDHPDDFSAFLESEAGFSELWTRSVQHMLTEPLPEVSLADPGKALGQLIRVHAPDVPILKEALIRTVEFALDPAFIALMIVAPHVAIVGKTAVLGKAALKTAPTALAQTKMLLRFSSEMAVGGMAAEELGLPTIVGELLGPTVVAPLGRRFVGGVASGFSTSRVGESLARARMNPVIGEPATEVLVARGQLPNIRKVTGPNGAVLEEQVLSPAEAAQGRHTLRATSPEGADLGNIQWRENHIGNVVVLQERQGLGTFLMETVLGDIAASGSKTVTGSMNGEGSVRLFKRFGATFKTPAGKNLSFEGAIKEANAVKGPIATINLDAELASRLLYQKAQRVIVGHGGMAGGAGAGAEGVSVSNQARLAKVAKTKADPAVKKILDTPLNELSDADVVTLRLHGKKWMGAPSEKISSSGVRLSNLALEEMQRRGIPIVAEGAPLEKQIADLAKSKAFSGAKPVVGATAPPTTAGPSVELMESYIEANITRPEAQDVLRRFSEAMSHVPGMKQLVKMFNMTAISKDPVIRGSFGYNGMRDIDDAARQLSMGHFRGRRVPFAQNHIGQIWLPEVAPANRLDRGVQVFRRSSGKGGEWIAQGDLFESVRLGEARYIKRLSPEQVDWINSSMDVLDMYSRMYIRITGAKINKLPAWWPRFIKKDGNKTFVSASGRKPPAAYKRVIESQEQSITELGFQYQPSLLNNMDNAIEAFQRVSRDKVLADWFRKNKIIVKGKKTATKELATAISPYTRGVIKASDLQQVNVLIRSPAVTNPGLHKTTSLPRTVNAIARLILTGTVDAGWGAIQLQTLAAVNPGLWAEAMGRGFFNMMVEPKQVYRFLASNKAAARYSLYGGNVGLETEFFQATRMKMPMTGGTGAASKALEAGTFPLRTFIHRMQTGFETTLLYGRVLAFDSLAQAATVAGKGTVGGALVTAAGGPEKALVGEAFHQEMFRLARFTDTMLGQPKLRGIITGGQAEIESAFVWFATRYTRSVFGTISYIVGKGYTPAQARLVMGKMLLGGSAMYAGFVAAVGKAQGLSPSEIQQKIKTGLNPASGKEFYSMKFGDAWFGLGGAYRSFGTFFAGLADKDSWTFETWESKLWDNPVVRGLRTRTSPTTGTLMDFLEGEDFLGYPIQISDMLDNPKAFADYMLDNFSPITLDALMQDMTWEVHTARFAAEYFGLRTSPETRFEAETAVMNRISQEKWQVDFEDLEHNMIAQNIIREHPDVKRAAEGFLGLIRERERDKSFRLWDEANTELRDRYSDKKMDLDDAVTGVNLYRNAPDAVGKIPPTSRMDGTVYRDEYRKLMAAEFNEVQGMRTGFAFEFEEEEAPKGTVDFIMEEFFDLELEDYIDPDTLQPDWEAWFADGDAVLEQLPEEWKEPADVFLHRRESDLRRDFSKKFESIINESGYFQMRETVAAQMGFSLNALEDLAIESLTKQRRRASPGDVGKEIDRVLNLLITKFLGDGAPSLSKMRQMLRENNPKLDVELLRQGFVSKVRSEGAIELGLEYMNETFPQMGYFSPVLTDDVAAELERK